MILNFSTLPNVIETVKNGTTKRSESCFPNIVCAANCLLSFYYGKLMLDWTLLISGLIGCICYSSYILVFVQYCPRESIGTSQLMMGALWFSLFGTNHLLSLFGADFHLHRNGFCFQLLTQRQFFLNRHQKCWLSLCNISTTKRFSTATDRICLSSSRVAHFAIIKNLVFATTSKILRILVEHIKKGK